MESVPQNTILKPNLIKRKLEDTGTFMGSKDNKTGEGFVRGTIVGFEMMGSEAGTGEDLKRISE